MEPVKKIVFGLILLFVSGVRPGAGASSAPPPLSPGIVAVWANDGGDKVTRDECRATDNPQSVRNRLWDGSRITIFGARNEVVSFNLVLEAGGKPAEGVSVSFDALTGPNGVVISSIPAGGDGVFNWVGRNIELFYVRYLQIRGLSRLAYESYDERHVPERLRRPHDDDGNGFGTWTDRPDHDKFYPEIAVPLELHPEFSIGTDSSQCIWADIYIPKTAPAGIFRGTLAIAENGGDSRQIPVELEVKNFILPDIPAAKTMVYLGYEDINLRYLGVEYPTPGSDLYRQSIEIADRHFQLAHRHKISLIEGYTPIDEMSQAWVSRLDGELFTPDRGYQGVGEDVGNNVYSIGTYGSWPWQGGTEAQMRTNADAWVNWFESHDLTPTPDYFLYLIDESDDYPQIEEWSQWINDNPGPGQRLMSLATINLLAAAENTPNLDIPADGRTMGVTEEYQSAADGYLAASDKRFYCYNSGRPLCGSLATEDDGVSPRELAWAHYKMDIDRWFFWESTYYNNFQGGTGQTNVFQSAQTFGGQSGFDEILGETGWNYGNGDGVLFYPGTDLVYPAESYGRAGPFASLRLKLWRRGIQDVDYLTLASAIAPVRVAQIVEEGVPLALWEYGVDDPDDPTWVRTDISWSIDPDGWEEARSELADIIESGKRPLTDSGDYDGDGTSDTALFRPDSGLWAVEGVSRLYFGRQNDTPVAGDYDQDGTADISIFRRGTGLWAIREISRFYFGTGDDIPVPGDYDGDGDCDAGIFRSGSGLWAIRGITRIYFGRPGDEPAPGYYQGAEKTIAIFRPSSGLWALRNLSRFYFGSSSDKVVPADFNGDGDWEAGIFRKDYGLWAMREATRLYFGNSSDLPVPGDYAGNGSDGAGIFRDSSGLWAFRGFSRLYYGQSGDIPVSR